MAPNITSQYIKHVHAIISLDCVFSLQYLDLLFKKDPQCLFLVAVPRPAVQEGSSVFVSRCSTSTCCSRRIFSVSFSLQYLDLLFKKDPQCLFLVAVPRPAVQEGSSVFVSRCSTSTCCSRRIFSVSFSLQYLDLLFKKDPQCLFLVAVPRPAVQEGSSVLVSHCSTSTCCSRRILSVCFSLQYLDLLFKKDPQCLFLIAVPRPAVQEGSSVLVSRCSTSTCCSRRILSVCFSLQYLDLLFKKDLQCLFLIAVPRPAVQEGSSVLVSHCSTSTCCSRRILSVCFSLQYLDLLFKKDPQCLFLIAVPRPAVQEGSSVFVFTLQYLDLLFKKDPQCLFLVAVPRPAVQEGSSVFVFTLQYLDLLFKKDPQCLFLVAVPRPAVQEGSSVFVSRCSFSLQYLDLLFKKDPQCLFLVAVCSRCSTSTCCSRRILSVCFSLQYLDLLFKKDPQC